jgi:pimeloyl-ACP methyl ester carboxylesterase
MHRPQSLGLATAGNPLGIAAWILERFHDWSDRRLGPIDQNFGMDMLVTNIMIYLMSDSFATSLWLYQGSLNEKLDDFGRVKVSVPTAFAAFPHDALLLPPPRSLAERSYNIVRWSEFSQGGHSAALEQPVHFLDDLRAWGKII